MWKAKYWVHIYCVWDTNMKNTRKRTRVDARMRNYLAEVAGRDSERQQLLRLMETSKGRMAPDWKFDREETHER